VKTIPELLVSARNMCTDARLAVERKSWIEALDAIEAARIDLAKARMALLPEVVLLKPACRCGATKNDDGSPVLWKCQVCDHHVCRKCTMTIAGSFPLEYFTATLCSQACWEAAGKPKE